MPDDVRVVVEHIGRRGAESREAVSSAISIWRRLSRDKMPTNDGSAGGDDVGADDDDDDVSGVDDDTVEVEEKPETSAELGGRWLLQDVSFTVRAGEGVAVVGGRGTGASMVIRLLDQMLHLDKGRIELRGRASRTATYNLTIAQPDASFREMAEAMALVARIPRKQRRAWVDELMDFALLDESGAPVPLELRALMRRLAVAAQFDPTADVLLVDELSLDDRLFAERCLERGKQALAAGGAAVLAGGELVVPMIELCSRALRLENGLVAEEGDPAAQLEIERRRIAGGGLVHPKETHAPGFDARAAMLAAHVTPSDGTTRVDIELETAAVGVTVEPRLVLRPAGARMMVVRHRTPMACERPGRYLLTCTLSLPEDMPGVDVDAILDVRAGGVTSEIARTSIGTIGAPQQGPVLEGADVDLEADAVDPSLRVAWDIAEVEA